MRNHSPDRLMRRGGVWMLMWAVLAGMGIEWLLHGINNGIKAVLYFFGLRRLDAWLRSLSFRGAMIVFVIVAIADIAINGYKLYLLTEEEYLLIGKITLYQHFTVGFVLNYLRGVFHDQLISVRWIASVHRWFTQLRAGALAWIRERPSYIRALELRGQFIAWKAQWRERVTVFHFARRAAEMHRCCFGFAQQA